MEQGDPIDRREFLRRSAAAGVSLSLLPVSERAFGAEVPRVRRYAPLGRTGLEISDISFGSSRLGDDPALVRHALDRGVNYFDTAERYTGGSSEETLGRALEGERNRVYLASKTRCGAGTPRAELMRALEGSLRRLRTDRIDVYFNHAVNDVARLGNEEWYAFAERAKEQGKIRFTGISGHGGRLRACLDHAIEGSLVDVVLVAYNFGQDPAFYERFTARFDFVANQPDLPEVLGRAKQKGIGVIAMKTLHGGRLNDLRAYEAGNATFAQAAFRWVLSNSDVDALIVSMKTQSMIDEYLGASGHRAVAKRDLELLDRYADRNTGTQCRHGCDACEAACPSGVAVSEVLRTRMYARDQGDHAIARDDYARLGQGAEPCLGCASRTCTAACPYGLPVDTLTEDAARLLRGPAQPAS